MNTEIKNKETCRKRKLHIGVLGDTSFQIIEEKTKRDYIDARVSDALRSFRADVDDMIKNIAASEYHAAEEIMDAQGLLASRLGADIDTVIRVDMNNSDAVRTLKRLRVSLRVNARIIERVLRYIECPRYIDIPDTSCVEVECIPEQPSCLNCKWMCFGHNEWYNADARCALGLPRICGENGMHCTKCRLWEKANA